MSGLFASGRIVDLILGLVLVEGALLAAYHRRTGRGVAGAELWGFLLAGACLLLALRCSLTGAGWPWIGCWLAASLGAHLADLGGRWRR